MTIRKTLLVAFLGVGLLPAILLASLAFVKARQALQGEIEANMSVEAVAIAADVDKMMFERLQNAAIWSRLDVMQDLKVHDVDKRLSRFLLDLQTGYRDVYLDLSCLDNAGRIVSSSDPSLLGTAADPASPWLTAHLSGADLELRLQRASGALGVIVQVPVKSGFSDESIGHLRLRLDWSEIHDVLDRATKGGSRSLAILDGDGRVIAASDDLLRRGFLLSDRFAPWRQPSAAVVRGEEGAPFGADVIVATGASRGYALFGGFGWTTLIIQPVERALLPVHRMAMIFVALLGMIVLVTLLVASWVSHEIARPILALTGFARGYMSDRVLVAPTTGGTGEVGELTTTFVRMVEDIDLSQQNLMRASKLAVIGEMSSLIAHEVRTPLGILRSSAQVLRREHGISTEGRELLGFIESETERLNRLVSAMLDTAAPRTPTYARVNMHEVLRRTVALLTPQASAKGVHIVQGSQAADAMIDCDEEQMIQVALNLLMNGVQVLADGGHIEIATRQDADDLLVEIGDDGPGIAEDERARVFDAFFFKREGGVGLGLAVVQQIVSAHAGRIEVTASAAGGALFRIRLPRHRQPIP